MDETKETTTISMAGCKYKWDDIDRDARGLNMNRSQFIQSLYLDFKEKKSFIQRKLVDFTTLLLLIVVVMGVVILLLRV